MSNDKNDKIGKAGLIKIDLQTNKIVKQVFTTDNKEHSFGDFLIAQNGDIYISDNTSNEIYILKQNATSFETIIKTGYFASVQGLAFGTSENIIIAADYAEGVFSINVRKQKVTKIIHPDLTNLRGIDGLYQYKDHYIAVQNGSSPNRIIKFSVNNNALHNLKTLEVNNSLLNDPTLGHIVNNTFYYIANSQWSSLKRNGEQKDIKTLAKSSILKMDLK